MASARDTATFFTEGSASQFQYVLSLYPQALKLKAERKTKKPEELIKLDNWWVILEKTPFKRGLECRWPWLLLILTSTLATLLLFIYAENIGPICF